MGAGASTGASTGADTGSSGVDDVSSWSKEEVGERVAAIGAAFQKYRQIAIDHDVDGETLLDVDDEDLEAYGVALKPHRKKILKKVQSLKHTGAGVAPAPSCSHPPVMVAGPVQESLSPTRVSVRRFSKCHSRIFLSYARGHKTTPFARWLKSKLEGAGYAVWMDEEGIQGGVDFMHAIGEAIYHSDALVAVIDAKFCGSTYCNNEIALAQGSGCKLLPCIFRGMTFDAMPHGLKYMLASINCVTFPNLSTDESVWLTMLDGLHTVLDSTGPQPSMRHTRPSHGPQALAEQVSAGEALALAPSTVPEPPVVVCERNNVMLSLITNLLGFTGIGAVSDTMSSKLSLQGQEGAGKTTLVSMMVRHEMLQRPFDRIAWVSVGHAPDIVEAQLGLYKQLTGVDLYPATSAEAQLKVLKDVCVGKRWLVVLDDVWDSEHERLLNCVDIRTMSKVLVTTRVRALLEGCEEICLGPLSLGDAVDLLLRTGGVESNAETCKSAEQIAELCGRLPLYLGTCGGIIRKYGGSLEWQVDVVRMLQEDGCWTRPVSLHNDDAIDTSCT